MNEMIEGYVEHIIFRNSENGYTVFELISKHGSICCVGVFPYINEGEFLELEGSYVYHKIYGEQFKISKYSSVVPQEHKALERYLSSGAIKGIGQSLARRVIEAFGDDTMRIIEDEPERLSEIKGISIRKARDIAIQMEDKFRVQNEIIFLTQYGLSLNLCIKIQQKYNEEIYSVIQNNPYLLCEEISGISFKMADIIASKVGIRKNSPYRIQSGFLYVLSQALLEGNLYLPKSILDSETESLLQVDKLELDNDFTDLLLNKKIIAKRVLENDSENKINVYLYKTYMIELSIAAKLKQLNVLAEDEKKFIDEIINGIEKNSEFVLDKLQRQAVIAAALNGILILTGGPGTGKTTTIRTMIRYFEALGKSILLAAPTGRAAKRMEEACGRPSSTIHRMLEQFGDPDDSDRIRYARNADNPLEADVIFIDEASMVDIFLMQALLNAVLPGTRLIFIGDVNQLPSVGPGRILQDIIDSNEFQVIRLNQIFRQAALSDIVVYAHKINNGEHLTFEKKGKDFFFLARNDVTIIQKVIVSLVLNKLPAYLNVNCKEIQVLSPMRKGPLGIESLNIILQRYLNPPDIKKNEHEYGSTIFRVGDKVMQIKNNYQLEWEIRGKYNITIDSGTGVFNGDIGIINSIDTFNENLTVEYDDARFVEYDFKQLDELELAYAITVHKAQGSEYAAIVMPILNGPKMLFTRNLLYTAVTRARNLVVLTGNLELINSMIDTQNQEKRYTSLKERLLEVY